MDIILDLKTEVIKKMSITKNVLLKMVLLNEKKIRKIPMIFDVENLLENQILALFDKAPLN